jgi:tetratricopeptide (TPR) repeat protein
MKHGKTADAEKVLAKVVALGGTGEDWLGLGVAQLANDAFDKAEGSLKGAQNLLPQSPYPSLHLAKVYRKKEDPAQERTMVERAIVIDPKCVDAWAYLYTSVRTQQDEAAAVRAVEELASATPNRATAAPYVALQGFYSGEKETRDRALAFARTAVEREPDDSLALISLSALHGQKGELQEVIKVLEKHETKMTRDVRLANNYFEALMQARDLEKVTRLLNALVASPNREVKQFAIERSRVVAQILQQSQKRPQPTEAKG